MKKILSVFICLLLIAAMTITAMASGTPSFSVAPNTSSVKPGEKVTLTVSVSCSEPRTNYTFYLTSVPDVFEVTGGSAASLAGYTSFNKANKAIIIKLDEPAALNCIIGTIELTAKSNAAVSDDYTITTAGTIKNGNTDALEPSAPSVKIPVVCATHKPGAAATCTTAQICTVCDAELEAAKGHKPGAAATCTTAQTCTVCDAELEAAKGHTEVIDKAVEATCSAVGKTEGKHCSVCNTVIVAQTTIAKKPHTEVVDKAVEATCSAVGKTEGKHCSVCNTVIVAQTTIAKKPHTEVVDKAVAATCTEDGLTEGKHCSVCKEVLKKQEVIPAAHKVVKDTAVAATCTEAGKTEGEHCSVCNEVLKAQEEVKALGHKEVAKETTAATCGKDGVMTYTCSRCNVVTKTEAIKATGKHDYTKSYKDNGDGTHSALCACGAAEAEKHDFSVEGPITVKPSTSNAGKQDILCVCGAKTVKTLPQLPADLDDVPKTGDVTIQITMGVAAMISMAAAAAFVFKRKIAK